jgi:hypothetical protein
METGGRMIAPREGPKYWGEQAFFRKPAAAAETYMLKKNARASNGVWMNDAKTFWYFVLTNPLADVQCRCSERKYGGWMPSAAPSHKSETLRSPWSGS